MTRLDRDPFPESSIGFLLTWIGGSMASRWILEISTPPILIDYCQYLNRVDDCLGGGSVCRDLGQNWLGLVRLG